MLDGVNVRYVILITKDMNTKLVQNLCFSIQVGIVWRKVHELDRPN